MVLPLYTAIVFPFGNLNNQKLVGFISYNNNESKNSNCSLILKPPPDLALLFNQFNNAIPENNSDTETKIQSKYYDTDKLQQLKIPSIEKSLVFISIPTHSIKILKSFKIYCNQKISV